MHRMGMAQIILPLNEDKDLRISITYIFNREESNVYFQVLKDGKDTDTEYFYTCNAELTDYQVKRAVDEFHNMLLLWASMKAEEYPIACNADYPEDPKPEPVSMPIWNGPYYVYPSFPSFPQESVRYNYNTGPFKTTCSN